jgi:hypothetical protein
MIEAHAATVNRHAADVALVPAHRLYQQAQHGAQLSMVLR